MLTVSDKKWIVDTITTHTTGIVNRSFDSFAIIMKREFDRIYEVMATKEELGEVKKDVSVLKEDVGVLKTDMAIVKENITNLNSELAVTNKYVRSNTARIVNIEKEIF